MATFKELKNKLRGKKDSTIDDNPELNIEHPKLEIEEVRYLLSIIAKSDFSGKDIQIVYNIALKLQNMMKYHLDKENNG